ncbi:MAG: thermonuclease family protein [Candidatus Omnitrophica bacterium]|nr:thermonuclease family protein [Candidatus Omnitrophota bacterium]
MLLFLTAFVGIAGASELKVEKVLDGESLILNDGRIIRLIGVKAPPLKENEESKKWAGELGILPETYQTFGLKSKGFLAKMVAFKSVETKIDPAHQMMNHHDSQRRFLAYLFVDNEFINAKMIREGYASTEEKFPFRYRSAFLQFQEEAKEGRKGFWQ